MAFMIDLQSKTFSYGDPASKTAQPDPATVQAFAWWISQHVPSFAGNKLTNTSLTCAGQDFTIDSWNCGLFSFNALEHTFLPERYRLLENTNSPVFTDLARLEVLRRLIKQHNVVRILHELVVRESHLSHDSFVGCTIQRCTSFKRQQI